MFDDPGAVREEAQAQLRGQMVLLRVEITKLKMEVEGWRYLVNKCEEALGSIMSTDANKSTVLELLNGMLEHYEHQPEIKDEELRRPD